MPRLYASTVATAIERMRVLQSQRHGIALCTSILIACIHAAICEPSRLLVDLAEYSNLIDVRITLAHFHLAAPPMSAVFQLVWRSGSGTQ